MALRRRYVVAAVAALVLGSVGTAAIAAQTPEHAPEYKELSRPTRPHETKPAFDAKSLLVRFKSGVSTATKDKTLAGHGARSLGTVRGTRYVKVRTDRPAPDVLRALQKEPSVQSVELNFRRRASAVPNDPAYAYGDQAYLNTVRLPQAWDLTKGSLSQVIAVVDTGVNVNHEDLVGRTVAGYNVLSPGATPMDDYGHGTMVAGIAAANTNNGKGIAGAAWTAKVMPVKVLDSQGMGYDADIAAGITWAADHGAKIINLSLGGPGEAPALHDAITYATGLGALVVGAAGNDGNNITEYPAAYPEVLSVGAIDGSGNLTDFSTYGDWLDVAAPGWGIVSTGYDADNLSYYIGDGTSFAAPIVSGVAALIRTRYPTYTPADVISRIESTARDAGPRGLDPYYGHGVVDAYAAVGGWWAPEFPQRSPGSNEPNDVPARATTLSTSVTGTIGMEGDVDWYKYTSGGTQMLGFTVTPAAYDPNWPANLDPILTVYDQDLKQLGTIDTYGPGGAESLSFGATAGTYYIAVSNYNGAADTRAYTLSVGPGTPVPFSPYQAVDVGSWPEAVAVGDVTGDGRSDVLMTTSYYFDAAHDYKLWVFAQQPDGTLAAPVAYPTGLQYADNNAAGLALLDVDGDDHLDVALATNAGLQVFRQTASGVLEDTGLVPGTNGARHVVAADMDGDSDADLVTTGTSGTQLLTRQADGTFAVSAVTAESSSEAEVGDVDGDGRPDVVELAGTSVRVYHHTDAGWSRTVHATGSTWSSDGIEVADVNGDGRADVVASVSGNSPNSKISVLTQNASGQLNAPVLWSVRDIPEPVEAADITGDSRPDVVTAHGGWNALSVLPQMANGTLGVPQVVGIPYASHYNTQGLALGDINGDGKIDAVVADYNSGLVILRNGTVTPGEQGWVWNVSPSDFATGAPLATTPTVTFKRPVDPASVTSSTVKLVNGRTGADVPATVTFDATGSAATITPSAALQDNTPYRIVVSGLKDTAGAAQADRFTTTFRTVDLAPPPVSNFRTNGSVNKATLTWTKPAITDLDQVIVRMTVGGLTPPSSPTSGTAAYAGTASTATISVPSGKNYAFSVWVRDRSGKYSTAATGKLRGTALTISSSATAITYRSTVTVTGRLTRPDTGEALPGVPVELYGRQKGTSTWTLLATVNTSSTGNLSYVHKPLWSLDYQWMYRGNTSFFGVGSTLRAVGVRTYASATFSSGSIPLGQTVTLSGSVSPSHVGQTVYLQRSVNGVWSTVTSTALSSTSQYSFSIKPGTRGTYAYRVYKPADTDHLAGYSAMKYLTVS